MLSLNPFTILMSVVDRDYCVGNADVGGITSDSSLLKATADLAKRNGLQYHFVHRLMGLGAEMPTNLYQKENEKLAEFKKTMLLLSNLTRDGIEYVYIKGCDTVPHIPRDVDIFARSEDADNIHRTLGKYGAKRVHSNPVESSFIIKGYTKLDVYHRITYLSMDFIDRATLWSSRDLKEIYGITYTGLAKEVDFVVFLAHTLFGHRSMSLLDFLHMKNLMTEIGNMARCREYASQAGWAVAFDSGVSLLKSMINRIYFEHEIVSFPYLFQRGLVIEWASTLDKLEMKRPERAFFLISLGMDWLNSQLLKSPLYDLLAAFPIGRKAYNRLGHFVRFMCGERHGYGGS